jgi:hypothetical protein
MCKSHKFLGWTEEKSQFWLRRWFLILRISSKLLLLCETVMVDNTITNLLLFLFLPMPHPLFLNVVLGLHSQTAYFNISSATWQALREKLTKVMNCNYNKEKWSTERKNNSLFQLLKIFQIFNNHSFNHKSFPHLPEVKSLHMKSMSAWQMSTWR